jgi:uncharacterized membrane protein (DUF485 family)
MYENAAGYFSWRSSMSPNEFITCLSVFFFNFTVTLLFTLFAGTASLMGRCLSINADSCPNGIPLAARLILVCGVITTGLPPDLRLAVKHPDSGS